MQRLLSAVAATLLAATATAQLAVVIPAGTDVNPGNSSNAFPWGTSASAWPGLRLMCIYDASNFTSQSISGPILINRLRWRPDNNAAAVTGGTFATADVRLSTAPMDYTGLTTNFATNHGPDLTTVYSGPVVHTPTPGSGAWTVTSWCIDINLTTPFLYDPAAGDLVIDCDYPNGSFSGGSVGQMDVQGVGSNAGRIWASSLYPNANGSALDHGVVVEVGYVPPAGYARANSVGSGCGDEFSSFFENLAAFDLSNTSLLLNFLGTGYLGLPGTAPIAPQSSTPVSIGDDVVLQFPLGWTLPYTGGTTTSLAVSSNGFVHLGANTNAGCCAFNAALFFNGGSPCIAAKWRDLNPAAGGTVQFDTDPVNGIAYVTFTGVPDFGTTNTNDFQYVFYQSGSMELRWGNVAATAGAVGFSPGNNALTPPQTDLSTASLILIGNNDRLALAHSASARPVIGTNITLQTNHVPPAGLLGATVFGLTQLPSPVDLSPIGMPGCSQYGTADASQVWIPVGGAGSTPFALPSSPAFAGISVITQAVALVPGINATGALTSNAMLLVLDVN